MKTFLQRPTQLHLYPTEMHGTSRGVADVAAAPLVIDGLSAMADYVFKRACSVVEQVDAAYAAMMPEEPEDGPEDNGPADGGKDGEAAVNAADGEAEGAKEGAKPEGAEIDPPTRMEQE